MIPLINTCVFICNGSISSKYDLQLIVLICNTWIQSRKSVAWTDHRILIDVAVDRAVALINWAWNIVWSTPNHSWIEGTVNVSEYSLEILFCEHWYVQNQIHWMSVQLSLLGCWSRSVWRTTDQFYKHIHYYIDYHCVISSYNHV